MNVDFRHENAIPEQFTCEGEDISPSLYWTDVPEGTQSLALIVEDPDAPDPEEPKRTFTHWLLYNLPPDSSGLQAGVDLDSLPPNTAIGANDFGQLGWVGPCPPVGRHRYFFKLYALKRKLPAMSPPSRDELLRQLDAHVIERAELMGTYEKHGPL